MKLYSNEIVFRGHPDKVCDQIAGAILDECLKQDKYTRAGIEVTGGKGKIFITGEITTRAKFDVKKITKRVLHDIGYSTHYKIINNLGTQSRDIAQGVDVGGAGDQGMMFGYACNDTEEKLPLAQVILQEFAREYDKLCHQFPNFFYPDGKAQITGEYDDNFKLTFISTFVCSYNNSERHRERTDNMLKDIIYKICVKYNVGLGKLLFNPTGKFLIGGFEGDAGVCGRKIVVDAYQSFANVGGGNMNGKDPSKVDMSAAHKARQIACRMITQHNLKWCEVQLSYAIGVARPVAIYIDSDKGYLFASEKLYTECEPANIIKDLRLRHISYEELAKFGHFTHDNTKGE